MPTVKQKREAKNKEEEAVAFYIAKGWTPEQALGIVGNLIHESGLNTTILGKADDKGSRGLAQWHSERLKKLQNTYGDKWTDFRNQLEFINHELNTTEKAAGDKLRASKGAWEAGQIVSDYYERPKVKFNSDDRRQRNVADLAMRLNGVIITPSETNYADQQQTTAVNQLQIPIISGNFAGVSDSAEKEEETDKKEPIKEAQEVQQQTNEYNFLKNYQEQYAQQQNEQIAQEQPIQIPTIDVLQTVSDVNQFVDTDVTAQQGGKPIADNLGYLNPKNWGKNVKIDGGNITMDGVNQPLIGRANTGETKLMLPNQNYTFNNAEHVIESPLTKEEQMFLQEYSKLQVAQQGRRPFDLRENRIIERESTATIKPISAKFLAPQRTPTIEELMAVRPDLTKEQGVYFGTGDDTTYVSPMGKLNEVVIKNTFKKKKSEEFKDIKIQNEALEVQKSKESTSTITPSDKEVDITVKASEDFAKSVKQKEAESLENFKRRSNELDVKDEPLKSEKDLTTSESILQVQQKLKRAGYNLNPEGKFKNDGLDGKMGKVTRQALEDYNKSGEKLKYTPYKTGEGLLGKCREEQCSEFVQNEIFRNTKPNVSRQQWNELTGLQGDAWRIGENIIEKGGKQVEDKKVKPGETVTMYTGGFSSYLPQAKKYGTDATHIGVIDKVNPDGSYYILHNVHEGNKEDGYSGREYRDLVKDGKIQSSNIKRNFDIRGIYRPNYEAVKDYDKKVKVRDDVNININDKSFNKYFSEDAKAKAITYTNSLNKIDTKKVLSSKYGLTETDYQSLAKAALGILAQESKFGTSKKLIPKQVVATVANVIGLKKDEVSKGAGQLKYETNYGDSDLTELGINEDNFTDDNNTALVVFDRLANYYKNSKDKSDKEGAIYKAVEKYNRGSNTKYSDEKDADYVNKVLRYSDLFTVKDNNNIEYNTLTDKLNLNHNVIKKQKILLDK